MSASAFDKLGGELQDVVMESAYLAQVHVQAANEAALVNTVDQIKMAEEMCSPEFQPALWEDWRERLNGWSGGRDTYQEIYDVARQNTHTLAENVEPRRWWKA